MKNLFQAARVLLLDLASTVVFLAIYLLTDNLFLAVGVGMALGIAQIGWDELDEDARADWAGVAALPVPRPHPPQVPGSMTRVSSGRAAHARLAPRWPFWPPCGRAGRARLAACLAAFAFASAAGLSWLGGSEELPESRPACRRSAATSARSVSISAACSATTARSSENRAVSSAFRAASSL